MVAFLPCTDIVNIIRRIRLLGFTAIRLPFSMQNLINATARDFQWTNCPNIAASDIINSVTNPSVTIPGSALKHSRSRSALHLPGVYVALHLRGNALRVRKSALSRIMAHSSCSQTMHMNLHFRHLRSMRVQTHKSLQASQPHIAPETLLASSPSSCCPDRCEHGRHQRAPAV